MIATATNTVVATIGIGNNPVGVAITPHQPQAITFTSTPPSPALFGGTYTVAATGGDSGNPVTFSSLSTGVCTVSGSTVSFIAVGSCTVAADQAAGGNYTAAPQALQTFNVIFAFTGFGSPVANAPTANSAKAGHDIKVKFSLAGNQGLNVLQAGSPTSGVITGPCSTNGFPASVTPTTASAPFTYDPVANQYMYSWQTQSAWIGSCRQFILILSDGTVHRANFQFNK